MPTRMAICLYEETIDRLDPANLLGGQPLKKINLRTPDPDSLLCLKPSHAGTPEWTRIVDGFADLGGHDTSTASSGAILFFKISKRIIACCFGTSVANINRDNIVPDFGLAVAYHRIPKGKYKKIETFAMTENPITNARSAAMPSSRSTFNLDTYLETITELGGKFLLNMRSVVINGKEFFSIPAPLTIGEIKKLCRSLIEEYAISVKDDNYKKLTAVSKVKTKRLVDYLNEELCKRMQKKSSEIYLVDYQQFDNLDTYSLTPKGEKLTDLDILDVYKDFKKGQPITTVFLRTKQISTYNADGQPIEPWSLYKCLFFQIEINIGGFILYKGHWYQVQKRFLDDLQGFVRSFEVPAATLRLPAWDGKQPEGDYNLATALAMGIQCWDKRLYTHPDYSYGVEFCDLLAPSHVMHVKKLASSALNSHLLMQTAVSAQLLKSDLKLKTWIKKESQKHRGGNIFLNRKDEYKAPPISYVIVLMSGSTTKSLTDKLPFFSLITFNMLIRKISFDFDIKICQV
jgi:uncharacterized protein (TIGR04141 family)